MPSSLDHQKTQPLSQAVRQAMPAQQGFSLLGIILVTALGSAVVAGAFTAYVHTQRTAQARSAAQGVTTLGQRIRTAYAGDSNFESLNTTKALRDGIYPARFLNKNGQPENPWGGPVEVAGIANGFVVTYEKVDVSACPRFVMSAATGWADVTVGGTSIMAGRKPSALSAGTLCNQAPAAGATVQFMGSRQAGAVAAALTACTVPPPQYQNVACPAGQISSVAPYSVNGVTQQHDSVCLGAYGSPIWTPWTTISNTCVPSCATQLAALTPNPQTGSQTVPRSALCPAGQTGSDTWTQQQTQSRTATCAGPTPVSAPTWGAWSAWTDTGPRIGEVNTCSPTCATRLTTAPWQPNPQSGSQTVTRSALCPTGQTGSDTWTQQQTHQRSATCAVPGAAVDPVWGAWSAWTDTGPRIGEVNTCTPTATWSWQVDASNTYYNYEPSSPGNAPNVQYNGSYSAPTHPGCYTCWPTSNMDYTTCQVGLMMDSCTCDAGNAGAEFLEQWSDAGNGVGQNAYICSKS